MVANIDSGNLVKVLMWVLKICPPTSIVMIDSDILKLLKFVKYKRFFSKFFQK